MLPQVFYAFNEMEFNSFSVDDRMLDYESREDEILSVCLNRMSRPCNSRVHAEIRWSRPPLNSCNSKFLNGVKVKKWRSRYDG